MNVHLVEAQWTSAADIAVAMVTAYGLRVVGAIAILIIGWMVSRILYRAVVRLCERSPRIDRTVALKLWGEIVRVPSRNDTARLELLLARMTRILRGDERVLRVAAIGIHELGGDKYTLGAQFWAHRHEAMKLRLDLNRTIKEELDRKPSTAMEHRAG